MVGTSTCIDSEASKGAKKKWTSLEDEALVSCMVDLYKTGTDNREWGFKSGYLGELEKLLKQKMPNSGIKARPHIESRLKTLKKDWGIVFDMVCGPHSSKFRWDYKRNVVIARSVDWDAYLMTHKDATAFRFRSFPHFKGLTLIYGKERTPVNLTNENEISSGGASSPGEVQGFKGNKRKWNPREDEALVSCMVELYEFCSPKGDSRFKSGYLLELERMLDKKLPNCGLKGKPHIESRIKTLKKDWSILYEMINGPHDSNFKWDSTRKIATADVSTWDAYLASHREAASFRFKAFPHFEDLTFIYAKNHATGQHVRAVKDILHDLDINDEKNGNANGHTLVNDVYEDVDPLDKSLDGDAMYGYESTHEDEGFHNFGPNVDNLSESGPVNDFDGDEDSRNTFLCKNQIAWPIVLKDGESSSSAIKRKRTEQEESPACEAEKNLTTYLLNQMQDLRKEMGRYFGLDSMRQQIAEFNDVMEMVEGLTVDEKLLASHKIVERPPQMFLFLSLKPELRLRWIRMFLANN